MEEDKTNVQTASRPAKPDPALKRLDILVGRWELKGRTLDTAEDNITGWVIFEWLPGRFFLEARGEIDFMGTKIQSLEILGYDLQTHIFRQAYIPIWMEMCCNIIGTFREML